MADVAVPDRHDTSTGAGGGAATTRLGPAERGLAFALVVLFLVAIAVMYWRRDDRYWDRLLFLFGVLEALVFAREEARVLAERGTRLADTMRVFAAGQRQPARTDRPGARPEDLRPATTPSEMASLVELANLWFPPRSG